MKHELQQGRARGPLAPPGRPSPAKKSMFLDFFRKTSILFAAFQAKCRFLLPLENSCPPLEKSLRTPMLWSFNQKIGSKEIRFVING